MMINSSSSTFLTHSSASFTQDPQFITIMDQSPPDYLHEIHEFLDLAQFEPNLGDNSYIINRAPSSFGDDTWEFENVNKIGSCNLIASHSPLQQTAAYCSANSSCFSPWAAPKHGGFILYESKPEGQLLLKNCLLKMLPWMNRNHACKRSQHYIQAEVMPGSQTVNYSNLPPLPIAASSSEPQEETTNHHMLAERTRRRKEKECLKVLRALLPKSPKKDKISVLLSAIEQLKELKACNEDLYKHVEDLDSTNAALKYSSSRQLLREGHMSINTNIPRSTSLNSSGGMVLLSPDSAITSFHNHHHHHSDQNDIHHGSSSSSSSGRATVSINSSLQSDNTLIINALISARLTLGSDQLIKVLTCLEDLGLQTLSVESRLEGDIFMAEISTRTTKDSSCSTEAQIQDAMMKALSTTDYGN